MSAAHHASDFTRAQYRRLLRLAKTRYVFRRFDDFKRTERFVLWRHDVDLSVHSALRLARIEKSEGVSSTYFLHLHSAFYNLLEPAVESRVRAIIALGHQLGLHFDCGHYGIDNTTALKDRLGFERDLLEDVFQTKVTAFSFHNPAGFATTCRAARYAGMINVYSDYFRSHVGYVSDSNGYWRYRRLSDVLAAATDPRLQVLTHPGWWQTSSMAPRMRVERCAMGRARATLREYDRALAQAKRRNIQR